MFVRGFPRYCRQMYTADGDMVKRTGGCSVPTEGDSTAVGSSVRCCSRSAQGVGGEDDDELILVEYPEKGGGRWTADDGGNVSSLCRKWPLLRWLTRAAQCIQGSSEMFQVYPSAKPFSGGLPREFS